MQGRPPFVRHGPMPSCCFSLICANLFQYFAKTEYLCTQKATYRMKRLLLAALALLTMATAQAQQQGDSRPFQGYLYNKEYDVYFRINFYDEDVIISWQDIFGPLPGFLAKSASNYCWIVTQADIDGQKAELEITNDYGSEDLTATLTQQDDTTYVLKQKSGSTLKIPNKNKWQKLPATLTFIKRKTAK